MNNCSLASFYRCTAPHFHMHAAERWAECVMRVVLAESDTRTVCEWSRVAHVSPGTLRDRCRAAGCRPKASLDFARVLRAVVKCEGRSPHQALDILHERTLRRILTTGGLTEVADDRITPEMFLTRQCFILSCDLLDEVRKLISEGGRSGVAGGDSARARR
jgi:hypothetical protein